MSSDVEKIENLTYQEGQEEEDNISLTDLSELLKKGTKEVHDRAKNTQFVKDFLKGRIKRELFKVFEELDKIGALLTEETQDGGLLVHDGKGDMSKCPFYVAKPADASACCGCLLALLWKPWTQAKMVICVALLAMGLATWYLM